MFSVQTTVRAGLRLFLLLAFLVSIMPQASNAQGFSVTIRVNENGQGLFTNTSGFVSTLPVSFQTDNGPGGFANALTYSLLNPPGLTAGDLLLSESAGGAISDVIRFNPTENCNGSIGCLVFYSDNLDGIDSLADIGLPTARYTNTVSFAEIGPEGNNGLTYTPLAGQPGFVAGSDGPVTYVLQSDSSVPEPSSILLLGTGLGALIVVCRNRVGRALQL
jgi:hypothetical protein